MIENEEVAREICELMIEFSHRLDDSMLLVKRECSAEESRRYARALGEVLGAILLEVKTPIYARHPSLKPPGWD